MAFTIHEAVDSGVISLGGFNVSTNVCNPANVPIPINQRTTMFSRLNMHNIKIKDSPQPTHRKPPAISMRLWQHPEHLQPCIAGDIRRPGCITQCLPASSGPRAPPDPRLTCPLPCASTLWRLLHIVQEASEGCPLYPTNHSTPWLTNNLQLRTPPRTLSLLIIPFPLLLHLLHSSLTDTLSLT